MGSSSLRWGLCRGVPAPTPDHYRNARLGDRDLSSVATAVAPVDTAGRRAAFRVRWLGRVGYRDGLALQRALFSRSSDDHLLLLEHNPVYTLGRSADDTNLGDVTPTSTVEVIRADRGGDVTFHGPGQLVGYPIVSVPGKRGGGMADTVAYVHGVEQLIIDALTELGLKRAQRLDGFPGVWLGVNSSRPRKIAAVGVRLSRGRSMHGFALNVTTDLDWFAPIVPCGLADKAVTSLAAEGIHATMREVVDTVARLGAERWAHGMVERSDVVWREPTTDLSIFDAGQQADAPTPTDQGLGSRAESGTSVRLLGRLAEAGVEPGLSIKTRKPEHLRVRAEMGSDYRRLKRVMTDLDLTTVCEQAGCPNIYECWADGTATFMILGEQCTRACGFCLVDTKKPSAPDPGEPSRVAEAVARMQLEYAVITMVARDDLPDGGASQIAATIGAVRDRCQGVRVEVLISDCRGDEAALRTIFVAAPDVLNHNLETVARLQRAVRPSAGYARSLSVLARAKQAGLVTKSSLMVGLGETHDEMIATMADLAAIGTDIVTIGHYLRPTSAHLPVARWWQPHEFDELKLAGEALGIAHVEASALTRSSYHAKAAHSEADVATRRRR